jgi:hypothetical protein
MVLEQLHGVSVAHMQTTFIHGSPPLATVDGILV